MNRMRVLAFITSSILVAACGGASPATPGAGASTPAASAAGPSAAVAVGEPIRIGASSSLSGANATIGQQYRDSYMLWQATANKAGGITVAGKKHPVEVIVYDDKTDATQAASLIEKLIAQDKVNFVLGANTSGLTFASSVVAERHKIPMIIGGGGTAVNIYERGFKYIFSNVPLATEYMVPVLDLAKTKGVKTVGLLAKNEVFSQTMITGARAYAKQLGMEIVYDQTYPADALDFTAQLLALRGLNPDMFLASGQTAEQILLVKGMKELKYSPKMFGVAFGPVGLEWATTLKADGMYAVYPVSWTRALKATDPVMGTSKEFAELYQATYKREPQYHEAQAAGALTLLKLAIEKCNCLEPQKVRDSLAGLNAEILTGPIKFNEQGRNPEQGKHQVAVQVQENDKRIAVWPNPEGELVFPFKSWASR